MIGSYLAKQDITTRLLKGKRTKPDWIRNTSSVGCISVEEEEETGLDRAEMRLLAPSLGGSWRRRLVFAADLRLSRVNIPKTEMHLPA